MSTGTVWTRVEFADAQSLNPILVADQVSDNINVMIFPRLLEQDPMTGAMTSQAAMAERWEVSADGLTWTFHLRRGVTWSDGDPVDAADFEYTYSALASDKISTPHKSRLATIATIETPDPLTVVVKVSEARCDTLFNLALPWLPSHLYAADFSDVMNSKFNDAPPVSAGPFVFSKWIQGEEVVLTRNEKYWAGAPQIAKMIFKVVPDVTAQLTQLQAGAIDVMRLAPNQLAQAQALPRIKIFSFQEPGYDYIALNLADPLQPQAGLDDSDKPISQAPHPILGDLRVRQAIAYSLDYQTLLDKVYLGQGYRLPANGLPALSWAYNSTLNPYPYDRVMAQNLLTEAGWLDHDGDGIREQAGRSLSLSLITNSENPTRYQLGTFIREQLRQVGFAIEFKSLDFDLMVDQLLGQRYDMAISGWTATTSEPDDANLWSAQSDTPGDGFNFVSYYNPQVEALLQQGIHGPACSSAQRAPVYKAIQQIIHDEVPYVFIAGRISNIAYRAPWQGLQPGPWNFYNQVQQWHWHP